ncbi:MAG: VOC family protein [Longimicrobiales bacterium]
MGNVKAIPDGYPQLSPYICVDGAEKAIEFYSKVFGARERMRIPSPGGKIGHAELEIGDAVVMLSDEHPEIGVRAPTSIGGTGTTLSLYVEDVDAVVARAVKEGAKLLRPVENQFYGDRSGQIEDPFGHRWGIATHIEDVSPDEMQRRAAQMMGG